MLFFLLKYTLFIDRRWGISRYYIIVVFTLHLQLQNVLRNTTKNRPKSWVSFKKAAPLTGIIIVGKCDILTKISLIFIYALFENI